MTFAAQAQDKPSKPLKVTDKSVKDTVIKEVNHKLYVGNRGGKYIIVTSKSGTQYKKYFKNSK